MVTPYVSTLRGFLYNKVDKTGYNSSSLFGITYIFYFNKSMVACVSRL